MPAVLSRRIVLAIAFLAIASGTSRACAAAAASPATVAWFQKTEQELMDSLVPGDKAPWERVMDSTCTFTTEEGEVLPRQKFLDQLHPLPAGLKGGITVKELTVDEQPGFAVVRFLLDEWEAVFGQRITTQYRTTDTFRRAGDTWKLIASHASVVTHDPPPQPVSSAGWPGLVGRYRLLPDGWTFTVELRDGELWGGRDPKKLERLIPLAPDAFVVSGMLGDWIFVPDEHGRASRIVWLRKFEPIVWTRVD